jgi:putative transposase
VRRAAGRPYSPHQKGKIEPLHRTIGEGLIAALPHYTGGPRRADGTLYAQPAPLTLPQLQTWLREFIHDYNTEHAHASLGRLTPAQKWATSAAPLTSSSLSGCGGY